MVVCKYVGTKADSSVARGSMSPRSPAAMLDTTEDLFLRFTDAHRKILNVLVRNNPSLMSGSFALLVQNPKILEFDNKRNYFTQQLRRRPNREAPAPLQVNVRREHVFEDSFSRFQRWTPEQIKYGKLNIRFFNEEGVDAGGVSREWFSCVQSHLFVVGIFDQLTASHFRCAPFVVCSPSQSLTRTLPCLSPRRVAR